MRIDLKHLSPGDADWLVDQHSRAYAQAEGFDESFGKLVAQILSDFEANHDPDCERAFVAWQGAQRLGSIFCVRLDEHRAKLRLFYLVQEARGLGLGHRLLDACMTFSRDAGYQSMELWTHESHKAACALYAKHGWQLCSSTPVHSFGVDLIEQVWRVDFAAET